MKGETEWALHKSTCKSVELRGWVRHITHGARSLNDWSIPEYWRARVDIPELVQTVQAALDGNFTDLEATYKERLAQELRQYKVALSLVKSGDKARLPG